MKEMKKVYQREIDIYMPQDTVQKVLLYTKLLFLPVLLVMIFFGAEIAYGEGGSLYTCNVHPSYKNPVTGRVEDSGGSASYATGQGMVNSALGKKGLVEITSKGEVYLNIRLKLMDHTSGHSFKIQGRGQSGWRSTEAGITAKGRDSNGTTSDVCIKLSSKDDIIRGEMYVNPMGRNVVFFIYADGFSGGNATDIKPAVVTKETGTEKSRDKSTSGESEKSGFQDGTQDTSKADENRGGSEDGLSLSTAQKQKDDKADNTMLRQIVINTVSIVVGGTVLMLIAAALLYLMKDWIRDLFRTYPDDEYMYEVQMGEKDYKE